MSSAKVQYARLTDVGAKRSHNQDACEAQLASDEATWRTLGHIFIVADGMGGHAVGEKASAKAIRDIPLTYLKHVQQEGVVPAIRRAFTEANADIFDIGQKNPEFKGLGTTGTALFLRNDGAWIGHVGDSRAYRIRSGKVEQLTFDHSWVWEIARRQGIDPDQLGDFKKNVIVRSLGPDEQVEVDIEGPHPVLPGDTFLLCSDGLTNEVQADEIGAVVQTLPPEEAAKFLIALANIRGGRDNITCIIVRSPVDPSASAPAKIVQPGFIRRLLKKWDALLPWPYTFLGLGSVCAVVTLILQVQGVGGVALPLFVAAAALILIGVIGLALHLQKDRSRDAGSSNNPQDLHIYKTYPFEIGPTLLDRFEEKNQELKDVLADHPEVNWELHTKFTAEGRLHREASEWSDALAKTCQAIQILAAIYNQERSSGEEFRPNWDNPKRN